MDENDPLEPERRALRSAWKDISYDVGLLALAFLVGVLILKSCDIDVDAAVILLPSGNATIVSTDNPQAPRPTICLPSGTAWVCD